MTHSTNELNKKIKIFIEKKTRQYPEIFISKDSTWKLNDIYHVRTKLA